MGEVLGMIHPTRSGYSRLGRYACRPVRFSRRINSPRRSTGGRGGSAMSKPTNAAAHLVLGRILSAEGEEDGGFGGIPRRRQGFSSLCRITSGSSPTISKRSGLCRPKQLPWNKLCGKRAAVRTHAHSRCIWPPPGKIRQSRSSLSQAELAKTARMSSPGTRWPGASWAVRADWSRAKETMKHALAEGTQDGRLFLHAAVIADAAGDEAGRADYHPESGLI